MKTAQELGITEGELAALLEAQEEFRSGEQKFDMWSNCLYQRVQRKIGRLRALGLSKPLQNIGFPYIENKYYTEYTVEDAIAAVDRFVEGETEHPWEDN